MQKEWEKRLHGHARSGDVICFTMDALMLHCHFYFAPGLFYLKRMQIYKFAYEYRERQQTLIAESSSSIDIKKYFSGQRILQRQTNFVNGQNKAENTSNMTKCFIMLHRKNVFSLYYFIESHLPNNFLAVIFISSGTSFLMQSVVTGAWGQWPLQILCLCNPRGGS